MDANRSDVPAPSGRLAGLPGYGRGRAGAAQLFADRLGFNEASDGLIIAGRPVGGQFRLVAGHHRDASRYRRRAGSRVALAPERLALEP